jgi:hypothetical protein
MPDVSLLIQSGYTPRKEWIERHFRVELEQKSENQEEEQGATFDPEEDKDLFGDIFGGSAGEPSPEQEQVAAQDLEKAANVMDEEPGAVPEEAQTDTIPTESDGLSEEQLYQLLGIDPTSLEPEDEEESNKPFGNQGITEDEAVEMDRK